ncbi:MAG: PglZ domain-containing protein [Luteibaculum sp.]
MSYKILWADDEIELLKPHLIFLKDKGYHVTTVTNGNDALEEIESQRFDAVFLDENMPGLTGLQTLEELKRMQPSLPVIMITKSEEEMIMEDAIGAKIADYLIKPVNPKQILLSLRKNLESKDLISKKTFQSYRQEFGKISMDLGSCRSAQDFMEIYKRLMFWELEMEGVQDAGIREILEMQHKDARKEFAKFVSREYLDWINSPDDESPDLSHTVLKKRFLPRVKNAGKTTFLVVVDNLRLDQWLSLKPIISEYFSIEREGMYCSILPTATHYARNSLFAGLMPSEIEKIYPKLWLSEDDEGSKNQYEEELFNAQLKRNGLSASVKYHKIINQDYGRKLNDNFSNLTQTDVTVLVYNFVDMLSHARTDMDVIKELAQDESAYRSITKSWFEHSHLLDVIKKIANGGYNLVITTDHGSVRTQNPVKIVGDRNTNTNLRYKVGKNLNYNAKEVFEIKNPADAHLPKANLSSNYVFALREDFFVYPNNYNQYVKMYKDTFQHGGVSMEEMLVPYIELSAK